MQRFRVRVRLAPGSGGLPRAAQGFTLLEMLVVVVLIALVSGLLTVNSQPDPRQALLREAERVGLLLQVAGDEARLRRASIAWEADLRAYRFVEETADGRATFATDDVLRERSWDPPLTRLTVVDLTSGQARTLLDPQAPAVRMSGGREWVQAPWRLELGNASATVAVNFDANGHASVATN